MPDIIGSTEWIARLDGRNIPREARALGEKVGAEGERAGADFGAKFDKSLTPKMRAAADKISKDLNRAFELDGSVLRRTRSDVDLLSRDVRSSFDRMFPSIAHARDEFTLWGRDSGQAADHLANRILAFGVSSETAIRRWGQGTGDAFRRARTELDRTSQRIKLFGADFRSALDSFGPKMGRFGLQWRDLSYNTRQWTLIIGAVAAGLQDLSVLSSAAGAGVLALGGGISALAGGGGALVAIFSVLGKDLDELPRSMQDAVSQAKSLGKEFLNTRDVIASTAFTQMPATFDKLSGTLRSLNPDLAALGLATGRVFDDFANGLTEGSAGLTEVRGLIRNATSDFPALARAAGTWTVALLRGINRANPLVDQLIGYVDKLGNRFDAFTRSNNFDTWVSNSMTTWSAFGRLLDATGRTLNDLVTPASIARTQQFLDNLTAFMPQLGKLLGILGELNVFGLAAQLLNEFGAALEPLSGPMTELASAVNEVGGSLIDSLAVGLGIVATIIGPIAQGLADVLNALPPGVIDAITGSVVALAGAFVVLKGVEGVAGVASALGLALPGMYGFLDVTGKIQDKAKGLSGTLKGWAGKAGIFAAVGVGVVAASDAFVEFMDKIRGVDDATRNAVASNKSFADSYKAWATASGAANKTLKDFSNMDDVLDALSGNDFWQLTFPFGVNQEAQEFRKSLNDLDGPLTKLANTDLDAATSQFSAWATQVGASDEQALKMLNRMDGFKEVLVSASQAMGKTGSDQDILNLALQSGTGAVQSQTGVINTLTGSMSLNGDQIDTLSGKLRAFADQNLTTRSASRDYEAAIDDLTQSFIDNGNTLDITTEQGRNNQAALDALAGATLKLRDETLKQTGSQVEANGVISKGRDELIKQLAQFGITGQAAEDYADQLGLVPANITTEMVVKDNAARKDLDKFISDYSGRKIPVYIQEMRTSTGRPVNKGMFATGGTVFGPTHALVGEAGPEAIVPLNRPLSKVDPSVRALSAIAQGLTPALAGGGIAGAQSKTVIFEAGAIVVQGAQDPRRAAIEVANEVADRVGS